MASEWWIKPHGDCPGGREAYCDIGMDGTWHYCYCGHKVRGWECTDGPPELPTPTTEAAHE